MVSNWGFHLIYALFFQGLVEIIKELGEDEEHRLCVKHLYGNWKKKYPGAHMKELMRMVARATTTLDWEKAML